MDEAFINSTGDDPQTLWADFLAQQAPRDLQHWGLLNELPDKAVTTNGDALLALLEADPENAAVLELAARHLLQADSENPQIESLLQRLADLRPLSPWPREQLATRHEAAGNWAQAADRLAQIAHARTAQPELLDRIAMAHRNAGRSESSLDAMRRAVELDPYDIALRERAAALAIEAGRHDLARSHIEALLLLEPKEPLHRRRLNALDRR
jgi:tetratricopeptide (TPR) repeat protein